MKQTKTPGASQSPPTAVAEYDWSKTKTTGFENVHREDLGIAFLAICQKGSPEFDETAKDHQAKKIEGIRPGHIFNNLTREVYHEVGGTPMVFIPCGFEKLYVEWKPRNQGGGMVRVHKDPNILNECVRNEENRDVHRNGNIITTTFYFIGLVLRGEDRHQVLIGMTSTQIKNARRWLNTMQAIKFPGGPDGKPFTPPMFSHTYLISTQPEQNEDGSWYGWKVIIQGVVKDPALIEESITASRFSISAQRTALPLPSDSPVAGDAPTVFA